MIFLKKLSRIILKGNEVIEKDSILWRASESPCEWDNAVTSPIIPVEPKSIGPEEKLWQFEKNYQMKTNFVM